MGSVAFTAGAKDIGGVDRLYAPRRVVLDALLLDAARAAGAGVRTGVNVTGVTRDSAGRVTGVAGSTHDGSSFGGRARWIVGADGVRSTVAGLVNSPVELFAEPANSCHYAYWSGVDGHHYIFAFSPGDGVGAIPSDDGLTCVFVNCPVGEVGRVRRHLDSEFRRLLDVGAPALAERVGQGTRVSGYRGMRGLPGYRRTPVGPGWLLVGDAGYHRDPYSVHGITDACRDAELAARAIRHAAAGHTRETDALREDHIRRNDFAVPMFHATARVASYEWGVAELLDILAAMGDEGEREARFLADLPELSTMRRQGAS